jgi:P27 family predicted phage terminase small subunit
MPIELTNVLVVPKAPLKLTAGEQVHYRRIGEFVAQAGMLSHIDGYALALLAREIVRAERLAAEVDEEGTIFTTGNGYPVPNPKVKMHDDSLKRIAAGLRSFGLQPAARKSIQGMGGHKSEQQAENARAGWKQFSAKRAK